MDAGAKYASESSNAGSFFKIAEQQAEAEEAGGATEMKNVTLAN